MAFQDFIEDSPIPQNPLQGAASEFQQEAPSFTGMIGADITNNFTRKAGSFLAENVVHGTDVLSDAFGLDLPNTQKISAQQINASAPIGNDGKPTKITDEPMYENVANMLIKDKQRELVNDNMTARYSNASGLPATFLAGAAATLADPASLAAMSYGGAILGGGKVLAGLDALGVDASSVTARTAARVVSGAAGGTTSMVPLAAAQLGISQYQGGDYDLHAALNDLAFGAVGGALIHGGFGALHKAGVLKPDELMRAQTLKTDFQAQAADIVRSPAPVKEAAINSTIADIVNGRPVDPESVVGRGGQSPDLSQIADDRTRQNQNGYSPNMTPEEIAAAKQNIIPNGLKVEPKPSRLPDNEINRYTDTVKQELSNAGLSGVNDDVVREIARIKAGRLNPEDAVKPRSSSDIEAGKPNANPLWKSVTLAESIPSEAPKSAIPAPKPESFPELPKALKGAKSPQFASDVDKALYIVREKSSGKSKSHDKYIDYLKNTVGLSDGEIRKGSEDVLSAVKANAEGKTGNVDIPTTFKRTGAEITPEDAAANKKMQERINSSEAAKNKKMGEPKNILQSIAQAGGMRDESGYLKNRDMRGIMTNRGRLYQKKGMSYDEALEHARDWITDKEYDTKNPETLTHDDLFDALEKEHIGKKGNALDYEDDLERHAGEMGIDTTGLEPEEIRDELERRTKEAALEKNFVEELDGEHSEHDYYPDMEESNANEASSESAHTGHEPEVGAGNERPEPQTGNEGRGEGTQPIDTGDAGRRTEGAGDDGGRAGAGATFEPAKNVIGGGKQGVLGGMEKSAKQAMESRGDKIKPKVEQKPADEGLFKSVIGGGDELDLRIASAEKSLDTSGMTTEERGDLQQSYKEAADADKAYAEKMKELGQCLNENGI